MSNFSRPEKKTKSGTLHTKNDHNFGMPDTFRPHWICACVSPLILFTIHTPCFVKNWGSRKCHGPSKAAFKVHIAVGHGSQPNFIAKKKVCESPTWSNSRSCEIKPDPKASATVCCSPDWKILGALSWNKASYPLLSAKNSSCPGLSDVWGTGLIIFYTQIAGFGASPMDQSRWWNLLTAGTERRHQKFGQLAGNRWADLRETSVSSFKTVQAPSNCVSHTGRLLHCAWCCVDVILSHSHSPFPSQATWWHSKQCWEGNLAKTRPSCIAQV